MKQPQSMDGLSFDDQNSSLTLEQLLQQSELLACMSRVDGKVLDIEKVFAETYLEKLDTEKSSLIKSHYDFVVQADETDSRLSSIMDFMANYTREEKYRLLRCLSALAICDGELHPKETDLIKQFANAMEIDSGGI